MRPAQRRKLRRGWKVRGGHSDGWSSWERMGTDGACGNGWGRLFSRQVQYSQCNGFLHEGHLCQASRRNSGRSLWGGGAEAIAWSSSWHHEPGQAGPEGKAGLPLLPGDQRRALRQVKGVDPFKLSAQTAGGLLFPSVFWAASLYGKSGQPTLSRPAKSQALLSGDRSLPVRVGIFGT